MTQSASVSNSGAHSFRILVACEQALHLGDIVKSTRARGTRERSRAGRFARSNRRACSQASILGSQKLSLFFFNFPVSRARPEKIGWFLLAATNDVQARLDCTSRIKILRQQRREKWVYWFLDVRVYSQKANVKARMSRIYYLRSRSSLGRFAA